MRAISPPTSDLSHFFNVCISGIANGDLVNRLRGIYRHLDEAGQDYNQKAEEKSLYQMLPMELGDNDIVVDGVSRKELKDLYSSQLVPESKQARKLYDDLKMSADLNMCPFCGFGQVSTLDHYLPKSKFPLLSIYPRNLVPCCSDCNKGKSTKLARAKGEQCLHPYYDHAQFTSEQWLYAEVEETRPASIAYFVRPPDNWQIADQQRVQQHFSDFDLARRFSIQASTEIPMLRIGLDYDFQSAGAEGVKGALQRKFNEASTLHSNCWKTAMYQALANNKWYCAGGFK